MGSCGGINFEIKMPREIIIFPTDTTVSAGLLWHPTDLGFPLKSHGAQNSRMAHVMEGHPPFQINNYSCTAVHCTP